MAKKYLGSVRRWQELENLFVQQPVCPYTKKTLTLGIDTSLDHITPSTRGGTNEISNYQWVYCSGYFDINWMKGDMTDAEFRDAIKLLNN